jgi:outer membrane receptor protein involved in Fe transport
MLGLKMQNAIGWDLRQDRIAPVAIYDTVRRVRLDTVREDSVRESSAAAWIENQTQWNDWLRSVVGWRVERFGFDVTSNIPENSGSRDAGIGLPKASLIFGPWRSTELFLNAGEAIHSNDARGVVARVDPKTGEPVDPATPLVRGTGAEIGVRTEALPHLQSSVALWYLTLGSELVFSGDTGTTEPSRPSKRVGIEWSNHYTPTSWLLLDLDLAWTRARFSDSDPAGNHIPEALQGTRAGRHHAAQSGRVDRKCVRPLVRSSDLIEDGSVRSRSTTVFNAQAMYQIASGTHLRFDVFNLFNAKADDITYYYTSRLAGEPPEGVTDLHSHPLESRTFRVGVIHRF